MDCRQKTIQVISGTILAFLLVASPAFGQVAVPLPPEEEAQEAKEEAEQKRVQKQAQEAKEEAERKRVQEQERARETKEEAEQKRVQERERETKEEAEQKRVQERERETKEEKQKQVREAELAKADQEKSRKLEDIDTHQTTIRQMRRIEFGVSFGVAFPEKDNQLFSQGFGKAYTASYFSGEWGVGFRFAEAYDFNTIGEIDAVLDGQFQSSSILIFRSFASALHPKVGLGASRITTSVVVAPDQGTVDIADRHGIAIVASAGIAYPISPRLVFTMDVNAYIPKWENVPSEVVYKITSDGIETGNSPEDGLPITASIGLMFVLPR